MYAWDSKDAYVAIVYCRNDDAFKTNFQVVDSHNNRAGTMTVCDAVEHVIEEYGIIPEATVWKHAVSGNYFTVMCQYPHDCVNEHAPDDDSEAYVYCRALDYDTKNAVWLGRRLFDNDRQLQYQSSMPSYSPHNVRVNK